MAKQDGPYDHIKYGVSFGQDYEAWWLDDPRILARRGIDPVENLRKVRACGDREAQRRGLIFIGEIRVGDKIRRQYVPPRDVSWWMRMRLRLFGAHLEKPLRRERVQAARPRRKPRPRSRRNYAGP